MQKHLPLAGILLVSDMDGTLVTSGFQIPQRNLDAIQRFIEKGGRFALATGRSVGSAARYVDRVPVNAPSILFNGAAIYDFSTKEYLHSFYLPHTAKEMARSVLAKFPDVGVEVHTGDTIYILRENEWTKKHVRNEKLDFVYVTPEEAPPEWNKLLFASDNKRLLAVEAFLKDKDHTGWDYVFSNFMYYEALPAGVTKGSTLRLLAELLHMEHAKTMAIGDFFNDLDLIKCAGFSAVPKAAPDELKEAANLVVGPCEDGAVADFIEYIEEHFSA